MTSDEDWTWKFTPRAVDQFDELDPHIQDRIISKLDEVVNSEWRDPEDVLEPLTGGPFSKSVSANIVSLVPLISMSQSLKSIGLSTGVEPTLPMIDDGVVI